MLCSLVSSYGFAGPEKPHWGSGQLTYIFCFIYLLNKTFLFYSSSVLVEISQSVSVLNEQVTHF